MDKPIYVKVDEFQDVRDIITLIGKKIDESKSVLTEVDNLKRQEEAELRSWHNEIEEVEKRVEQIKATLETE